MYEGTNKTMTFWLPSRPGRDSITREAWSPVWSFVCEPRSAASDAPGTILFCFIETNRILTKPQLKDLGLETRNIPQK